MEWASQQEQCGFDVLPLTMPETSAMVALIPSIIDAFWNSCSVPFALKVTITGI